jgi:hypothetical protein
MHTCRKGPDIADNGGKILPLSRQIALLKGEKTECLDWLGGPELESLDIASLNIISFMQSFQLFSQCYAQFLSITIFLYFIKCTVSYFTVM